MVVAFVGLFVNLVGIYLLPPEKEGSLNIEGVYQHVVGDAFGSVVALIADIGILLFNAFWLDVVASLIVALLIVKSGLSITIRSLNILIQASPKGIDLENIKKDTLALDGVNEIHDFHAWRVTNGMDVLTAHILENTMTSQRSLSSMHLLIILCELLW